MNYSDTEVIKTILNENKMIESKSELNADIILLNTCSIREKSE